MRKLTGPLMVLLVFSILVISGCTQTQTIQLDKDTFNLFGYHDNCASDGLTASPGAAIQFFLEEGLIYDIQCTLKIDGDVTPITQIYWSLPKRQRVPNQPTTKLVEYIDKTGIYYLYHSVDITTDETHEFTVCCSGYCDSETINLTYACWYQRENPR